MCPKVIAAQHPNLVITASDVVAMRQAMTQPGLFQDAFRAKVADVDQLLLEPVDIPVPLHAGGGYTHERHKNNYKLMFNAAVLYQLTGDVKYANHVRDMLLEYAKLYPTLPIHPQKKSSNAGKLFWQGLNEAVWLVYTIQAYDAIIPALDDATRQTIENGVLRPVALFLSEQSPHTFNLVHNHGTWATTAVGMTGYVLGERDWVEKALYDLEKSGKGGFLRQLDELFSPAGYYNEGPYYQRYALMPFVTFAKAIEVNEPERKIFEYRDGIVLKAIETTIQLSYNNLFFPLNDAIKSKGIDTIELVNGVAIAYGLTGETGLLSIAQQQDQILLTGDGLKVARAIEQGLATPFDFKSIAFGDGADGMQGAFVVMRQRNHGDQALVFKATAQGLGHGHFDKLNWQFYDTDEEIVSDYGAARFLNVEAKFGGRYLPENKTYAKQTVAHNTLVVDEISHFEGITKEGNKHHPELLFFGNHERVKIAAATIDSAYPDTAFTRTIALLNLAPEKSLVVDVLSAESDSVHQYDLPVHYQGHLIETNFELNTQLSALTPLGQDSGYQHLWLKSSATPKGPLAKVTWLNKNGRFYTLTALQSQGTNVLFTQLGANDPQFNLRAENAFIFRVANAKSHDFVSVLEPHGEYNPSKEYTLTGSSQVVDLIHQRHDEVQVIEVSFNDGSVYVLAFHLGQESEGMHAFIHKGQKFQFSSHFQLFDIQ
nr:heparinase II/III family protein [Echinimonas agarilytica]